MDNQGNNPHDLMSLQSRFYKNFAKEYLAFLGNAKPTAKQLAEMQSIVSCLDPPEDLCRSTVNRKRAAMLIFIRPRKNHQGNGLIL